MDVLEEYALFKDNYRHDSLVQAMVREVAQLRKSRDTLLAHHNELTELTKSRNLALAHAQNTVIHCQAELARRRALDNESKYALDKYNAQLQRENSALRENNALLRAALAAIESNCTKPLVEAQANVTPHLRNLQ